MRVLSLFSGCGGLDMGLEAAGMEIVQACEIDRHARAVYRRRWPSTPLHDDVRTLNDVPVFDIICGGFPCQDLSVAGKRAGLAGKRSGLFSEVVRLAGRHRPRWLLLENVPGLLSMPGAMAAVIRPLYGLGYRGGWRVLDLQWFGVPQRRRRVFLVFHLGDWRRAAKVLFEQESLRGNPPPRGEAGEEVAGTIKSCARSGGWSNSADHAAAGLMVATTPMAASHKLDPEIENYVVNSNLFSLELANQGTGGNTGFGTSNQPFRTLSCGGPPRIAGSGIRRLTPLEYERLMGWPDGWTAEGVDEKGRTYHLADGPRYKLCGNGVGAPVAEWLGRRIMREHIVHKGGIKNV